MSSIVTPVIEQYTRNVRFCIICNYVNKIVPAIQSRCTRFRFSPLATTEVEKKINEVIEKEDVKITDDGKAALLKLSKGDMRRALNILQVCSTVISNLSPVSSTLDADQACHAAYDRTDETAIYNCTGNPQPSDIDTVVKSMMTEEFTTSFTSEQDLPKQCTLNVTDVSTSSHQRSPSSKSNVVWHCKTSSLACTSTSTRLTFRLTREYTCSTI